MDFDELLILVDPHDRVVGHADKLTTHQDGGQLHRAFSVCVFNAGNEMLLQHRAASKYHFGGLWSNTCCGHPTGTNDTRSAAEKRLGEEFGFTTPLRSVVTFQYEAHDPMSGLTERELDHVFAGRFEGSPHPNPEEIDAFRWIDREELEREMATTPELFTPWFLIMMQQHADAIWQALR